MSELYKERPRFIVYKEQPKSIPHKKNDQGTYKIFLNKTPKRQVFDKGLKALFNKEWPKSTLYKKWPRSIPHNEWLRHLENISK